MSDRIPAIDQLGVALRILASGLGMIAGTLFAIVSFADGNARRGAVGIVVALWGGLMIVLYARRFRAALKADKEFEAQHRGSLDWKGDPTEGPIIPPKPPSSHPAEAPVEMSQQFFATVQNKMHWAAHGQTAAEVIHARVDAGKPFMGLQTTRPGGIVRKEDVSIAKNYLAAEELGTLNRIVNAYLEFAELRALQRKVMTMRDWIAKLDELLKLSEHELLDHAGQITAEQAKMKAELEYERYRKLLDAQPRSVDLDFDKALADLKNLPKPRQPKPPEP